MAMTFQTAEELADYQAKRELAEALRVQSMSPAERFKWLEQTWGRLQDDATALFMRTASKKGTSRCFASLAEKNRFDEDREVQAAIQREKELIAS
jgi:hypothetical protein